MYVLSTIAPGDTGRIVWFACESELEVSSNRMQEMLLSCGGKMELDYLENNVNWRDKSCTFLREDTKDI